MKMTLASGSNSGNENQNTNNGDNKSVTPNSSPRGSPRPSPRPEHKREHSRSDTHLTINYKEPPTNTSVHEGSPSPRPCSSEINSSVAAAAAAVAAAAADLTKFETNSNSSRKEVRGKKKSSWFNSFYPTYKSRSGDFRRLFKEVPDDERLVVDYSCALQKEILVQGRLYVTQNYLCFYANIFGWETTVTFKWKEVSAITKEKTARVIPNAILICTKNEKYFFTSFVARDKTYLMLFRVWQNALLDQPMSPQEMWQWVHQCYGAELGLTSDDEDYKDYIAPGTEEDKLSARLSIESFSEQEFGSTCETALDHMLNEDKPNDLDNSVINNFNSRLAAVHDSQLPTDMSDTTESDGEKHTKTYLPRTYPWKHPFPTLYSPTSSDLKSKTKCDLSNVHCTSNHEGRQLMSEVIPMHIDQLFTLLFTSSKFYLDFHASRKTTDLTQTSWTHDPTDNSKSRIVNLTVALNQSMGPKTAQVTECQTMLPCSKAGYLYAIDIDTLHAGIPYADSFSILVHYCLQNVSDTESSITVFAQVKYKKSVWGLVKGMIEKSCWSGLEDFYFCLSKSLHAECEDNVPELKRKSRRKRRIHSMPRPGIEDPRILLSSGNKMNSRGIFSSDASTLIVFFVLMVLVILNVLLYWKLWALEEAPHHKLLDLNVLQNPPKTHDEWIKLLQQQETLHTVEIQKWQRILKSAIQLLKQAEESLNELQLSISPTYASKIVTFLKNYGGETDEKVEHNEM